MSEFMRSDVMIAFAVMTAVTVAFGLTQAGSGAVLESTATVNFNSQVGLRNKQ